MDTLQVTFFAVLAFGGLGILHILVSKPTTGHAILAAMLSAGFAACSSAPVISAISGPKGS